MTFFEAHNVVKSGKLTEQSLATLQEMIQACMQVNTGNPSLELQASRVADTIHDEIYRRDRERIHQQQLEKHSKVQQTVEALKKPHWTLTPSFWVAVFAMIFAAIAAWPVIREWIPAFQPGSKDSNFRLQQSNSTPAILPEPRMSNAPASLSVTNH